MASSASNSSISGITNNATTCTATIITLAGAFTIFDVDTQSTFASNTSGPFVINGCISQTSVAKSATSSADTTLTSGTLTDPFWSAIFPLIFALAVSITLSYVLFLMTFMAKSRRPWLQRCGAFCAMVVLTLAADLIWIALEKQDAHTSYRNAASIRDVRANTVLKALRIVAETILWLAQVQVLIRLFPRHRDKVIIKWSGLCLIVLETVFAVLNDFFHPSPFNPDSTNALIPAIPALTYLFEIAIGVIYAACVVFYSISNGRWRYAYTLKALPSAVASIVSICSPIIFFCLDIWNDQVEGWGDYVRMASMVAATVLVWDWIDQIAACIDQDSHNGVLGREVFEDEMDDGKMKKHKGEHESKASSMLPRTWRNKTNRKIKRPASSDAIELPIIVHPLQRARADDTTISHSTSSRNSSSQSQEYFARSPTNNTDPSDVSLRSVVQHPPSHYTASQSSIRYEHRSVSSLSASRNATIQQSLHNAQGSSRSPIVESDPRQDIVPHPGFVNGDYWPDEKEGAGSSTLHTN